MEGFRSVAGCPKEITFTHVSKREKVFPEKCSIKSVSGNLIYVRSITIELLLEPVSRTTTPANATEHLKVLFVRGNEVLKDDSVEIGGSRVYGGAILSRNAKNNDKWLKVRCCGSARK